MKEKRQKQLDIKRYTWGIILIISLILSNMAVGYAINPNTESSANPELLTDPSDSIATAIADSLEALKPSHLNIGFDFVTRYVWRGFDYGVAPGFQPSLSYTTEYKKVGIEIGAWGSYAVTGSFAEIDLYGTFSFPYGWVGVVDYYYPTEVAASEKFYDFTETSTHAIEGLVGFDGFKKFPIKAMFGYNFFAPTTDPNGSWYVELSYPFKMKHNVELNIVAGAGYGDYYTQDGGFMPINIGLSASRSFSVAKDKLEIPVSISLITNPDTQKIFFVATVGLHKK